MDANTRYPIRKEVLQHTVYRDVEKPAVKTTKSVVGIKRPIQNVFR
ncbi:hypothetical protein IC611_04375 [Proteus mirabilis]